MKGLLIAAMIAILIGTTQAVRIKTEKPGSCAFISAVLDCGSNRRIGAANIKGVIDGFRN